MQTRSKRQKTVVASSPDQQSRLPTGRKVNLNESCSKQEKEKKNQLIPSQKISEFQLLDSSAKDPKNFKRCSIMMFCSELVHISVLHNKEMQEVLRIRNGVPIWLERSYVELFLHASGHSDLILPSDDQDCILSRFVMTKGQDKNDALTGKLKIYGCQNQHVYLTDAIRYGYLHENIHVDVNLECFNYFSQLRQKPAPRRLTFKGQDCMMARTYTVTNRVNYQDFSVTTLTLLQINALTFLYDLLSDSQPSLFQTCGFGFVKSNSLRKQFLPKAENTNELTDKSKFFIFQDGYLQNINTSIYDQLSLTKAAILATRAGSGKTLIGLLFVLSSLIFSGQSGIHLILVKSHLLPHWSSEVKKHVTTKNQMYFQEIDTLQDIATKMTGVTHGIFLVNFDLITNLAILSGLRIETILVDEAHTIQECDIFRMNFIVEKIICITATPEKQSNGLSSLIGLDHVVRDALFSQHLPLEVTYYDTKTRDFYRKNAYKIVQSIIFDKLLIRGKETTWQEVIPTAICLTNNVRAQLIANQLCNYVYNKNTVRYVFDKLANIDLLKPEEQEALLKAMCSSYYLTDGQQEEAKGVISTDPCFICLNVMRVPIQLKECNHVLCKECWEKWRSMSKKRKDKKTTGSCPICRMEINDKEWLKPNHPHRAPNFPDLPTLPPTLPIPENQSVDKKTIVSQHLHALLPNEQILIYCNKDCKAKIFKEEALKFRNRDQVAILGFKHTNNDETRLTIDLFQSGNIKVLILNVNKLADGLNFPNIHNLLIVDFANASSLQQVTRRIGASRLGSSVKVCETNVNVIMYEKSVQSWLFDQILKNWKQEASLKKIRDKKKKVGDKKKKKLCSSISSLPSLEYGRIPSQKHMLELEYYMTCENENTRMKQLYLLLISLFKDVKLFPAIIFQSGMVKPGKRPTKDSVRCTKKPARLIVQEVHWEWKNSTMMVLLGAHQIKITRYGIYDLSNFDCSTKYELCNALKTFKNARKEL
jgi:hypothetical protein